MTNFWWNAHEGKNKIKWVYGSECVWRNKMEALGLRTWKNRDEG